VRIIKKLPWAEIAVATIVLAAGAAVYAYAHRDEDSLEETKRRGALLVEALHTYHHEQGGYPDSLADLRPRYIAVIDPPTWGLQRWSYRTYMASRVAPAAAGAADTALFHLSVAGREGGYPVLYYDVTAERWVLNN
jgi:hypothetical protein